MNKILLITSILSLAACQPDELIIIRAAQKGFVKEEQKQFNNQNDIKEVMSLREDDESSTTSKTCDPKCLSGQTCNIKTGKCEAIAASPVKQDNSKKIEVKRLRTPVSANYSEELALHGMELPTDYWR